jgi:hypothetical protein
VDLGGKVMDEIMKFLEEVLKELKEGKEPEIFGNRSEDRDVGENLGKFQDYLFGALLVLFLVGLAKTVYTSIEQQKELKAKKFKGLADKDFFIREGHRYYVVRHIPFRGYFKVPFIQYGQILANQERRKRVKSKRYLHDPD